MKRITRLIIIIIGFFLLFIFCAPLIAGIFNLGNAVGIAASVVLLVLGFKLDNIIKLIKKLCSNKKGKIFFSSIATVATALALCFAIALGSVISCSSTNADGQETVIILGCAVYGYAPSVMLNNRVKCAYNYLAENENAVAILSGGQGNGENISEAECMYELLTSRGIDGNRLFLEDKSTNTAENIAFSHKIITENGLSENVAIASSEFHLKRATMIAKRNGLDAKRISAKSGFFDVPTFYVRDTIAVIKEFLLG